MGSSLQGGKDESVLNSPVNSKLTPPRRDPHSEWMLMQDTSSLMIVPKLRVLSPLATGTVLCIRVISDDDHVDRVFDVLPMHRITIQATGWLDWVTS